MKAAVCVLTFASLVACSGKTRPFADSGSEGAAGSPPETPFAMTPETSSPPVNSVETIGEAPSPVGGLDTSGSDDVGSSSGVARCGDAGGCAEPDAGTSCVPTGPRDCSSPLDNDCDGLPDNALDDVCRCAPLLSEPCDAHPGLDGRGPCRAGTRTCAATEGNVSSDWSVCEGAVGPGEADSCEPGDDADCDGTPNEGCACVDGLTQPCGPASDLGRCAVGVQTCADGSFGQCEGAIFPGARSCASPDDNDCDGRPDNLIDAVCQCVPGQGNGPCSEDANNARCGAAGRCEPCLSDIDCALVSGGRVSCNGGRCVVPLSPPGAPCQTNGDCESGRCLSWYRDRDGDTIGDLADEERTCGATNGASTPPIGYVEEGGDCCDLAGANQAVAATIFPGQPAFFATGQTVCPSVAPFDYDCSGNVEFLLQEDTAEYGGSCLEIPEDDCRGTGIRMWSSGTAPACGVLGAIVLCDVATFMGISTCQAIVGAGNFRNECH